MHVLNILKRTDVRIKLALVGLFSFLYVCAIPYPEKSRQFPQLIALFTLFISIVSLIRDFMGLENKTREVAQVDDTELTGIDEKVRMDKRKRFYKAWTIILFSTFTGFMGGFIFSALFLFTGFAVFFGKKNDMLKNIIIAVFLTISIYILFQMIMRVPLLSGILWRG